MAVWYSDRVKGWPAKAVIATVVLAGLLVSAVPVAFFAGVVMMLLGHVVGGLALFGASVLVAAAAVAIASLTGARQLRKLVRRRDDRIVRLGRGEYHFD